MSTSVWFEICCAPKTRNANNIEFFEEFAPDDSSYFLKKLHKTCQVQPAHRLWLNYKSGYFQFQRSAAVRCQSFAIFLLNIFAVNYLHTKIKKKRPIMTHLKINLSRTIPNLTNLHNNTSCKCILQTVARFFLQYLFFHNNDLCPIA